MGLATAFNVLIIFRKIEKKRHQDAFFDASLLVLLSLVFEGSLGGMMVATVASAIISLYFLFNPPNIFPDFSQEESNTTPVTPTVTATTENQNDIDAALAQYGL